MKKMYKNVLIFIFFIFSKCVFSQVNNLVPNPSFEDYIQCPNNLAQINYAYPWTEPSQFIEKSSDYYNTCSQSTFMNICNHIIPHSGKGFAGIYIHALHIQDTNYYYHEYIEVKLKEKLIKSKKYCASLFTILNYKLSNVATDEIGLFFSENYINQTIINSHRPFPRISVNPQISAKSHIILDTILWSKVSGSFISNNDESYLTIGNFFNGDSANIIYFYQNTPTSYYFIDDVFVCDCDDFKPKLGIDTTLCAGQHLLLKANIPKEADSVNYTWQDGSKDSMFLVTQPGIYWVSTYIVDYKITVTDTITVNYEDCNKPIWIPNSFTPNGDGLNDIFKPETLAELENYTMLIFNRWGELIYESKDITKGWDGKYKGKLLEFGVYTYRIEATDKATTEKKVFNGKVTLVY